MIRSPYEISMFVPGGVLVTDHIHRKTNDGTCSRCRQGVPDEEVPLMFFVGDGEDMLIYCTACVDVRGMEGEMPKYTISAIRAGKSRNEHLVTIARDGKDVGTVVIKTTSIAPFVDAPKPEGGK